MRGARPLAGEALFRQVCHQAKHSGGHGERNDNKCHYADRELISLEPIRHSDPPFADTQTLEQRSAKNQRGHSKIDNQA